MKRKKQLWWHPLDNAAKIFPGTSNRSDTKVFRFACQLNEPVVQSYLEEATRQTLKEFPIFQTLLKRGLFWYYLEKTGQEAIVREEDKEPCSPMFDKNFKRLLFNVSYYKNRINLEVHHVLTDGTGAIQFLRALVIHYLQNAHQELVELELLTEYDASASEKNDDSFNRYYEKADKKKSDKKDVVQDRTKAKLIPQKAYQIQGRRLSGYRMRIIEGTVPVKGLLDLAHQYHTTLTIFVTALVICSIGKEMHSKDKKKPVVIKVPVNLRSYFDSSTARNFFGVMEVSYNFSTQSEKLEDVIAHVDKCFKNELTREQLMVRMNKMGKLERNVFLRSVPLSIKDFFMKAGYDVNNRRYTFSLSNVGIMHMPEVLTQYIDMFDIFLSTDKEQACSISYNGWFRMTFTSPFEQTQIQKHFFRQLSQMGLEVYIESNELDEQMEEDT